jgi:hypothetical protein
MIKSTAYGRVFRYVNGLFRTAYNIFATGEAFYMNIHAHTLSQVVFYLMAKTVKV